MVVLSIPGSRLKEVYAHCEAAYPEEGCGVLAGPETEAAVTIAYPCLNIQNRLHAEDPEAHPRDARTAYRIDPADLFRITRELRESNGAFKAIFHSHADVGAYFSDEDQAQAAPSLELSVAAFARGEGLSEEQVVERLRSGALDGDPEARRVRARIPGYPNLVYLVVDVTRGRARGFRAFCWDGMRRTYVPTQVNVDGQSAGETGT